MKVTMFLFLIILNITLFAKEQSRYYKSIIQELNSLNSKTRQYELFQALISRVKGFKTANEILPYLDWLRDSSLNSNSSSFRYAALYGIYLSKVSQKETSKAMLLHSLLRLELDVLRCKNSKDTITKYMEWKEGIQSHLKRNSIPIDEKIRFLTLNLEESQKNRQGDKWLCGDIDFVKAIQKGQYTSSTQGKITNVRTIPSEDVLLPVSFVDDKKWYSIREDVISKFKKKYLE